MGKDRKKVPVRSRMTVTPRKVIAASPAKPGSRRQRRVTPYHHGALREALLTAAERILERDGMPGLTLPAAAREAGVSHAAPAHHFGDLTGLLSELAALGFRRFREALVVAADCETGTGERLDAMGNAYVSFARNYPGMFALMFRSERLDTTRPALSDAMDSAGSALAQAAGIVRAWAVVHGLAVLLLDGRLNTILSNLPRGETKDTLLQAVLKH